jgi:hypothetical protein
VETLVIELSRKELYDKIWEVSVTGVNSGKKTYKNGEIKLYVSSGQSNSAIKG